MAFGRKARKSNTTTAGAFLERRKRLLSEIESEFRYTGDKTGEPEIDPRVIEVLLKVPREAFVPRGEVGAHFRPLTGCERMSLG
jgi:hypothetical protein